MAGKVTMLALVIVAMLQTVSAAPGLRTEKMRVDITDFVNSELQKLLSGIEEPVHINQPLEIRANQENVAHIYIKMEDCELTGVKDFVAYDAFYSLPSGEFSVGIKSPKLTLTTPQYFINGTMVDHIELDGHGPGMISVDDIDIQVYGTVKAQLSPFFLEFTSAELNLEMLRWTVNLEDLMPGTDLGTVFNEFFSMYGPVIFDMIENNINKGEALLTFLNSLYPPPSSE